MHRPVTARSTGSDLPPSPPSPSGPTSGDGPAARAWPRVMVDRTFGRYLLGNVLTMLGIWVFNIVAVVVAYEATGSALVAGTVTAAQFVPHIVLSIPAGAAADRWSRRGQAAVGHLIAATGSGGLAVWLATTDAGADAAGPLILASVVVGIGTSIAGPAVLALVPSLVRPGELPTAVTLGMAPLPIGRAIGPVLGTTLAVATEPAVAFAVTCAASLAYVLLLVGLHPRPAWPAADGAAPRVSVRAYLRDNRPLVVLLVCVAAVGAGTDPPITLAPVVSAALTGGTGLAGPIATSFGVGAGLGFALIPVARRALGLRRYGYAGLGVMALGSAVATAPTVPIAVAGFALSGAGLTLTMTGLSSTLQAALPEAVRGRLMALWSVAFVGTRPLAAVANGVVADHLSPRAALLGMALVGASAAWLGLTRGPGSRRAGDGSASGR